jgi:hypothetical protein
MVHKSRKKKNVHANWLEKQSPLKIILSDCFGIDESNNKLESFREKCIFTRISIKAQNGRVRDSVGGQGHVKDDKLRKLVKAVGETGYHIAVILHTLKRITSLYSLTYNKDTKQDIFS